MTFTTMVTREDLRGIHLPSEMSGKIFYITITPASDVEEKRDAFQRLKGIIRQPIDLNEVRKERLNETVN